MTTLRLIGILLICESTAAASPRVRAASGIAIKHGDRPSGLYGFGFVELGVAFDVLVAMVLFGVFFFQIRQSIDSLDVDRMNRLTERADDQS